MQCLLLYKLNKYVISVNFKVKLTVKEMINVVRCSGRLQWQIAVALVLSSEHFERFLGVPDKRDLRKRNQKTRIRETPYPSTDAPFFFYI